MELSKLGCVNLRPRSRDLLRVRSEDLGFDPVKDRQQQQQLKREKYMQQQLQLQQHQKEWKNQQKKLQRQRKRDRLKSDVDKQNSPVKQSKEKSKNQQHQKQRAWAIGEKSQHVSSDQEGEDSGSECPQLRVVDAPLKAHFLKDKKGDDTGESDSVAEQSSCDEDDSAYDQQQSKYPRYYNVSMTDDDGEDSRAQAPQFSTDIRHRRRCGRCQIFYHYSNCQSFHSPLHRSTPRRQPACQTQPVDRREVGSQTISCRNAFCLQDIGEKSFLCENLDLCCENLTNQDDSALGSEYDINSLDTQLPRFQLIDTMASEMSLGSTDEENGGDESEDGFLYDENYCEDDYIDSVYSSHPIYVLVDDVDVPMKYTTQDIKDVNGGVINESPPFQHWDDDISGLDNPSAEMAPPVPPPRTRGLSMTASKLQDSDASQSNTKQSPSNSNKQSTSGNNTSQPGTPSSGVVKVPRTDLSCDQSTGSSLSKHDVDARDTSFKMGNNNGKDENDLDNNNANSSPTPCRRSVNKLSVRAILPGQGRQTNDPFITLPGDSPTAVAGVEFDVIGNQLPTDTGIGGRPGGSVMQGMESTETRRRNFSSSSLPLSLMTATIEEVEDGEYVGLAPTAHSGQRSNSYGGTVTPSPKVPFRTLRRVARVPSMSSPPRVRRPGPMLGLVRSASDNTSKVGRLRDVDIVGESFESRYPWQRDVGVQCQMGEDSVFHPNLERAMSGPAMYTYFRSLSMSSNSPTSSPPQPPRRKANSLFSCSHSDLISQHPPYTTNGDPPMSSYYQRPPALSRSNSSNVYNGYDPSALENGATGSPYTNKRANFRRRPRPSSMGAVENIRYQHELTKFRELHNSRRDRKSDPQLVLSPSGRRRVALVFPDDPGSVSDLESILENPGDRPWDISRQTSLTSIDFEEDMRYLEASEASDFLAETTEDYRMRDDVLPSPPLSPNMWATFDDEEDIADSDDSMNVPDDQQIALQKRMRRAQQPRRLSSGSVTSDAESEGTEPDPPVVRRGRRAAIYETKNCGDVSPTTLSPEVSPSNSCDEGEGASNIAERLRRRRSSVDLAMNIYPGDLLVQEHHKKLIKRNTIADFYAGRQPNGVPLPPGVGPGNEAIDSSKKGRQPFSLLKLMKTRSKESLTKLDEILKRLKPSEFKDNHLAAYKSLHWSDLIASTDKQQSSQVATMSDTERKRREAVWELFKSECVFLIDHLMVLKHCFMEPLKKVQVEGSLMFAEPQDLFGNLDELSYVSYTFCKDFIAALLKDMSITDFGRTNVLLKAFQRFSAHSRDGAVYHSYCLNYTSALAYLEKLRQNAEFAEFEKWCEQDPRCNRLQLTDLLVAPMQHCTKLPLLLHNVRKYTADEDERQQVAESIEKVETSLKQLEEKMRWIKNFERVQEIQRQIVWPTVAELDPRCVIPDSLKATLSKQPCEKLLACPKRQLLHEGQVTLVETPKPLDVHLFLFDDILLITKVKKIPRKQKQSVSELQSAGQSDRASYVVLRQPLALDRFTLHDISPTDAAANGLKHCFVLVHISRYQQITGVFTFQAACDATKSTWLTQIREAMDGYAKAASSRNNSFKENRDPKAEEEKMPRLRERGDVTYTPLPRRLQNGVSNSLRGVPTKSRSMDAVFI